ncbi:hypothetical protein AAG570_007816 [Ranatra chinensis]|uniref:Fork-head domain-containing protein n=1 Tax=Ranatra chinensis TaxID=642074 RepID=A0ABD0Y7U6_9HEMI
MDRRLLVCKKDDSSQIPNTGIRAERVLSFLRRLDTSRSTVKSEPEQENTLKMAPETAHNANRGLKRRADSDPDDLPNSNAKCDDYPAIDVREKLTKCDPMFRIVSEECTDLSWLTGFRVGTIFGNVSSLDESLRQSRDKNSSVQPPVADSNASKKPGLTYTELIEKALQENGELTVSGIYKWIYTNYPYFNKDDGRWKNSVRHNLSINPQFRKGDKCLAGGSGHFWTLSNEYSDEFRKWQQLKQGRQEITKEYQLSSEERETIEATKSILEAESNNIYEEDNLIKAANDFLHGMEGGVEVELMNNNNIIHTIEESPDYTFCETSLFPDAVGIGHSYEYNDSDD